MELHVLSRKQVTFVSNTRDIWSLSSISVNELHYTKTVAFIEQNIKEYGLKITIYPVNTRFDLSVLFSKINKNSK